MRSPAEIIQFLQLSPDLPLAEIEDRRLWAQGDYQTFMKLGVAAGVVVLAVLTMALLANPDLRDVIVMVQIFILAGMMYFLPRWLRKKTIVDQGERFRRSVLMPLFRFMIPGATYSEEMRSLPFPAEVSKIFNRPVESFRCRDGFEGRHGGLDYRIANATLNQIRKGKGGQEFHSAFFRGLLMSARLPQPVKSPVQIVTRPVAKGSFMKALFGSTNEERVREAFDHNDASVTSRWRVVSGHVPMLKEMESSRAEFQRHFRVFARDFEDMQAVLTPEVIDGLLEMRQDMLASYERLVAQMVRSGGGLARRLDEKQLELTHLCISLDGEFLYAARYLERRPFALDPLRPGTTTEQAELAADDLRVMLRLCEAFGREDDEMEVDVEGDLFPEVAAW